MIRDDNRTWLIRYPNNSFSRPLSEEELLKIFSSGEMKPQNEICAGNGYWFSLQDVKEMRKHFGNMPMEGLFKKVKEEVTQERYAVTAPIVVPKVELEIPAVKVQVEKVATEKPVTPKPVPPKAEVSQELEKSSLLMKIVLAILTLLVFALFFVWFG